MSNKEIALSYRSKGLSIIPIWSLKQIERKPPSYFIREFNNALEKNKKKENPLSDDEVYQDYVTRVCKRAIINWTPFQKDCRPNKRYPHGLINGQMQTSALLQARFQGLSSLISILIMPSNTPKTKVDSLILLWSKPVKAVMLMFSTQVLKSEMTSIKNWI